MVSDDPDDSDPKFDAQAIGRFGTKYVKKLERKLLDGFEGRRFGFQHA